MLESSELQGTFLSNVNAYLQNLPPQTFLRLYSHPATCLAIFRLLPNASQQIVLRLLFCPSAIPLNIIHNWVWEEYKLQLQDALKRLTQLHICQSNSDQLHISDVFRLNFVNAITLGGHLNSFGSPCPTVDKHKVNVEFLENYAKEQWETVLHFMVGTQTKNSPPRSVLSVLQKSGLMAYGHDGVTLKITNKGFQFLLQDENVQVWTLLLQYLDLAEELKMDLVEVMNFFFQLGSLQLGVDYSMETLTDTQKVVLSDLRAFGVIYQRKKGSRRYYPTPLATNLTSGNHTFSGENKEERNHFLIVETNSRVYAYTESPLQIAILNLFVSLKSRFTNMVTGVITRESIRRALANGITADQIITYIKTHAHPDMRESGTLLSLVTVIDQIYLWEQERNRLKATNGFLYQDFLQLQDFEAVKNYASELGQLLFVNSKKRLLLVSEEGHPLVKSFVKRNIIKQ